MSGGVVLKIFSGPHLGAEAELLPGEYVLGNDPSCDIVLSDSSLMARHALLTVGESADGSHEFSASPLDGKVSQGGKDLPAGSPIQAGTPFFAGFTCMAWGVSGSSTDQWERVYDFLNNSEQKIQALAAAPEDDNADGGTAEQEKETHKEGETPAPEALTDSADQAPSPAAPGDPDGPGTPADPQPEEEGSLVLANDQVQDKPKKRLGKFLLAGLLTCLLCFSWTGTETEKKEDGSASLSQLLREAGYTKLKVTNEGSLVTIRGNVASDAERGRILRLVSKLTYPVRLAVDVKSDISDAVRDSFGAHGLYLTVSELPPSPNPGIFARGYIKDGVLEEQAFSSAKRNVPELSPGRNGRPQYELFSSILHESEMESLLFPLLKASGIDDEVSVDFQPGRIIMSAPLTPQLRSRLEEIRSEAEQRAGFPLPLDIANGDGKTYAPRETNVLLAQAQTDPEPPAVKMTAPPARGQEASRELMNKKSSEERISSPSPREFFPDPSETGVPALQAASQRPAPPSRDTAAVQPKTETPPKPAVPRRENPSPLLPSFPITSVSVNGLHFVSLSTGEKIFEGGELPGGYTLEDIAVDELKLRKGAKTYTYPLRRSHE